MEITKRGSDYVSMEKSCDMGISRDIKFSGWFYVAGMKRLLGWLSRVHMRRLVNLG